MLPVTDSGATCVVTAECVHFLRQMYCEEVFKILAPILPDSPSMHSCRPQ